MNIFYLDQNPRKAAEYHCDKHVVKMISESCQMLVTAWSEAEGVSVFNEDKKVIRPTHTNHPCNTWVRAHKENYEWLSDLAQALCREYNLRYRKHHAYEGVINEFLTNVPKSLEAGGSRPALCMPDRYKTASVVDSYRAFYRGEKRQFATWKKKNQSGSNECKNR